MAAKPRRATIEEAAIDDEEDEEALAAKPKSIFSLKMIIIAAASVAVLGGGATAFFVFGDHKEPKLATAVAKPTAFFDVPEVLVNLSTSGGERTQYLKVKIV